MHVFAMVFAGIPDSRKTEERQGVAPAPADLDMLATLRLDACSSPDLMREQYRVRPHHGLIRNPASKAHMQSQSPASAHCQAKAASGC